MDLLAAASAAWSAVVAPPRSGRSPLEVARTLKAGDGPQRGKPLEIDAHPAIRAILEAVAVRRRVVVLGPVQDGKTYGSTVVPTLWAILEGRCPVLIAAPGFELAASIYTAKVRGSLTESGLAHLLPQDGAGSRTGVPDESLFATGIRLYLRGMGGANEAQQAGVTAGVVCVTEVDSIALATRYAKRKDEGEGRRKLQLIAQRAVSYGEDARIVYDSTIKDDRHSLIVSMWEESTAGRLWHPCPHCRSYSPREWSHVSYDPADDDTAKATARIACPACGVLLTPLEATAAARMAVVVHRGQRVEDGRVVGDPPRVSAWGIRWSSLDSPLPGKALDLLCAIHRDAAAALRDRGESTELRQFVRDHLTMPYQPEEHGDTVQHRTVTPAALALRSASSDYDKGTVPWPGLVALGIDMQEREAWWLALVIAGDRVAVIDGGVEYICGRHEAPTPDQRKAALDRIAARGAVGWPLPDGTMLPAVVGGVDVGGRGWLEHVDAWLRGTRWRWFAMRGDSRRDAGDGAGHGRIPGVCELFRRDDGRRLMLADPTCKARLVDGLAAPADSPVAVLLPRGIPADHHLAKHLCAEERQDGPRGVVWVARWKNDLFDAGTYAYALGRYAQTRTATARTGQPSEAPVTVGV